MNQDGTSRLPPPPLFTIRPPPTPPGSLFENFQTVEIRNGRCIRPSLNLLNVSSPDIVLPKHEESINWLNIFLLILAVISVICCIIIAIFIFICLKKLRKEEKQYQNYFMSGTLSSKTHYYRRHPSQVDSCTRTSEHYKCTSNCCDDYYSHQLMPMTNISSRHPVKSNETTQSLSIDKVANGQDTPQNHQYECIPEYLLTMTRHHHSPRPCPHSHKIYQQMSNSCGIPYNTFSRSYLLPQESMPTTNVSDGSQCTCSSASQPPITSSAQAIQEESSVPLLTPAVSKESRNTEEVSSRLPLIIGWTRRNPSTTTTKRKSTERRHSFLAQLRKSSI
ncbi:unnamed protein product, partial [Adineta ricciae]